MYLNSSSAGRLLRKIDVIGDQGKTIRLEADNVHFLMLEDILRNLPEAGGFNLEL